MAEVAVQDNIRAFTRGHPAWFLEGLSRHYPFQVERIEAFIPWLGLKRLRWNEHLIWTMELFLKYKKAMGFECLPLEAECGYMPTWWIPELYEKHPEYYPLECLGCENYWEWNEETITQWAPLFDTLPPILWDDWDNTYLNYNEAWESLCLNSNVKWTPALLERYKEKLNWGYQGISEFLGLSWSEAEIMPFEDLWFWSGLAENRNIIWTENMLNRHAKGISNWTKITLFSPALKNPEIVLRYQDKWSVSYIHENPYIRWDMGLWEIFLAKGKLDWDRISSIRSPYFPWSEAFIREHAEQLNWSRLSCNPNPSIPWSEAFLEQYQDRLDWGRVFSNRNPKIPRSEELLHAHQDQIYWTGVSENPSFPFTRELIEKYRDQWDWSKLQNNPGVPWDWDLLLYFADQVGSKKDFGFEEYLWNKFFAPHLDDALVLAILKEITPSLPHF